MVAGQNSEVCKKCLFCLIVQVAFKLGSGNIELSTFMTFLWFVHFQKLRFSFLYMDPYSILNHGAIQVSHMAGLSKQCSFSPYKQINFC